MEVFDFIPKYPNIENTNDARLKPYETNFFESIYQKKEFYDEKLSPVESFPSSRGTLMKHQKLIARLVAFSPE